MDEEGGEEENEEDAGFAMGVDEEKQTKKKQKGKVDV